MDKITIKGLKVYAYHGVLEKEADEGQYFYITVDYYMNLRNAGVSDVLADTVSYDEAAHVVVDVVTEDRCDLIETVAENICSALLIKYPVIGKVVTTVSKPDAPIELDFKTVSVTVERSRHTAYLGIGSNLGDRESYLDFAVDELGHDECIRVEKVSSYINTEPYGTVEQPDFLNGVLEIQTIYTPLELLQVINDIENEAGRKRIIHWGPRTLDIDILLYDDEIIHIPDKLIVPHVEMLKRDFVMKPLVEIAPFVVHPLKGKTAMELLEELEKDVVGSPYEDESLVMVDELPTDGKRIVYAGVPGAYAEAAAIRFFGENAKIQNVTKFDDIVEEVRSGAADYGVIPVENSSAGFVSGNYDLIKQAEVKIVAEVVLDIEHALLGMPDADISDIQKVYSHNQGLMQCKEYINDHDFAAEAVSNTALAAQKVREKADKSLGAIASERAAELYGLKVLARRINSLSDNATKFAIVARENIALTSSDNVSICFTAQHRVGALYEIMGFFNKNSINMTSIESRPSRRKKWEYNFYVSFEGKLTDRKVRKALGEIAAETEEMVVLGTF